MNLWPFSSKVETIEEAGLFSGITDWHSHIMPGVDDGFKKMEDSLKALEELEKLGVKNLWLTPHIMEDCPNETRTLRKRFEEIKLAYDGHINLFLGSENMLDSLFEDRLQSNDLLPLGVNENHLLVETSYFNPPMNMTGMLERIKSKGYYPVLAHPERYRYMDEKDYRRLKEMGILFQVNLFSLFGAYGETAQKKLEWLLKEDMVDLLGSDLHRYDILLSMKGKSARHKRYNEAIKRVGAKNHIL